MKHALLFIGLLVTNFALLAQPISSFFTKADSFLYKNIENSKVNYKAIKQNTAELDAILKIAATITIENETTAVQKAFWGNCYNLLVIKGICDKYPVKSPLDIDGFFNKITYAIGNAKLTLDDIENKIIRPQFKDPRFHFILVCAAKGCPPISNRGYFPATIENQLTKQAKIALNNTYFIRVNKQEKTVEISSIFQFYKDDFTNKNTTFLNFINKYRYSKIPDNFQILFYKYDWNLNELK